MDNNSSTKIQDCNVITQAFERGAHYNADEASVFATQSRNVQNTKFFSKAAQASLASYQHQPSISLDKKTGTATDAAQLSGMKIEHQYIAIPSGGSSSVLARAVKECVPCDFRLIHNIDLNVASSLISALKADVKSRLSVLDDLLDLLHNIDIYGDFCQMASFLNFMCVPDLQRMLVVLMSMLTDFSTGLLNVAGLLQALLAPFFTPVLMSINALLDQLVQLVLSPLNCIITSIEENIRKLDVGSMLGDTTLTSARRDLNVKQQQVNLTTRKFQGQVRSSLMELHRMLNEGSLMLRSKIQFYTQQLTKLLGQWGAHDSRSLTLANNKIITIRLVGLIRSMIQVKAKGGKLCDENKKPSASELDNFFSTFVSPNSPFNISVDPEGNLRISPKPNKSKKLKTTGSTANTLLNPPKNLPVRIIKCKLSTDSDDIDKVNQWILQLNDI